MAFVPKYILILAFTISIDYVLGILLEKTAGAKRKPLLIASILSNIGILFFFKYFNFFISNTITLASLLNFSLPIDILKITLPIGLSFHTFQSLSYIIEIYRGNKKAEKNYGIFALYVMFYPQLVAGPIERPQNMLHQFHEKHYFDAARVADGLKIMLWGLFKKVVIADRLAIFVNLVYGQPSNYSGMQLIVATIFFGFQIYCDFSGYSDIALGAAKVMGFKLLTNFDKPYLSQSVSEFWKRWHISLSSWFRDYVYIPMGGNRVKISRVYFNLFITFMLSGFWHGASWTYIIWGSLNGVYLIISQASKGYREKFIQLIRLNKLPKIRKLLSVFPTFSIIMFSWIFFRAADLNQALYIIRNLFSGIFDGNNIYLIKQAANSISTYSTIGLYISFFLILFLIMVELLQTKIVIREYLDKRFSYFSWVIYYAGIFAILVLGIFTKTQFIYFQF